jgi:lysozyme
LRALRFLALAVALAALAAALGTRLYRSGDLRFNYPSRARFPIQGIDVSHHQGVIGWAELRAAGVEFVFIKATEGEDHHDRRFSENWHGAGQAGLLRGAYHFFTFCTSGAAQAEHFVATIAALERELPPVADVEFSGNCRGWLSIDAIRSELSLFLRSVERQLGWRPAIYVTSDSHRRIVEKRFGQYPLWVRDLFFEPRSAWYGAWRFWQFADNARLPGIEGPVDLNVFCCARNELDALRPTRGRLW